VRKWVWSSISWFVQFLHILLFLGILVYLPVSMKSLSDKYKLFWLLNCENQEIVDSVGRFLYQNMP
jgi:hypothetical protein